jgi:hypothetical protein
MKSLPYIFFHGLLACAVVFLVAFRPAPDVKFDCNTCTINGFKMWGKIKVVESFPDVKVQIVESFPDLKVKTVESFPDECGKWKYVESFPDVKIKFVTSFPDIKIKMVDSFPGCK